MTVQHLVKRFSGKRRQGFPVQGGIIAARVGRIVIQIVRGDGDIKIERAGSLNLHPSLRKLQFRAGGIDAQQRLEFHAVVFEHRIEGVETVLERNFFHLMERFHPDGVIDSLCSVVFKMEHQRPGWITGKGSPFMLHPVLAVLDRGEGLLQIQTAPVAGNLSFALDLDQQIAGGLIVSKPGEHNLSVLRVAHRRFIYVGTHIALRPLPDRSKQLFTGQLMRRIPVAPAEQLAHRLEIFPGTGTIAEVVILRLSRTAGPGRLFVERNTLHIGLAADQCAHVSVADRQRLLIPDLRWFVVPQLRRCRTRKGSTEKESFC